MDSKIITVPVISFDDFEETVESEGLYAPNCGTTLSEFLWSYDFGNESYKEIHLKCREHSEEESVGTTIDINIYNGIINFLKENFPNYKSVLIYIDY